MNVEITGQNLDPVDSNPASIDFGALKAKAASMMSDDDDEPVAPAAVEPSAEVRVKGVSDPQPKVVEVKVADPVVAAKPLPTDLSDDTLVKVTVDGEEQILPWSEARGKISGGMKFTKNMQELAAKRAEWATEQASLVKLREERDQLNSFLLNKQAVEGYVKRQFPELFQPPQQAAQADFNPDEIATVGQARAIAQQQAEAAQAQIGDIKNFVQSRIDDSNAAIARAQEVAKHTIAIDTTLAEIYSKNPVLKSIPNSEDLIRFEVSKLQPQNEAEALDAFRTVSAGMVEEISKHYKANQKIEAVAAAKQKLESHSIEPAGGSAPQLKPTSFKNSDGQVDWKKVQQAAREML